jgi:hypothetical protein
MSLRELFEGRNKPSTREFIEISVDAKHTRASVCSMTIWIWMNAFNTHPPRFQLVIQPRDAAARAQAIAPGRIGAYARAEA